MKELILSDAACDYDPTCEIAHKQGLTARPLAAEDLAKI